MSDYLDADMPPAGRGRLERHLGECTECRRLLDGLRRMVAALHRLSAPSGDADPQTIAASVRARLTGPD